jgi:serine/threonine protein kinase/Tol biopolymer transport system component
MPLAPGTRLGPYEALALVGAGGMGEVYKATDTRLGRTVAIKVLPATFAADADRLRRFQQEARAAAALSHPNILVVYDVGFVGGTPYIVSELLEGRTLRDLLSAGPIAIRRAVEYAVQIARGLAAAHEKGIVHRDLKPENLYVGSDGRVRILDFGIAKLMQPSVAGDALTGAATAVNTEPGLALGTVGYMAPEQVRGETVDHRVDLFAFGAIVYEMLSGRRAFRGDTAAETMTAILRDDPPDPSIASGPIPDALLRIVRRCLEKTPAARFQTATDLAFALEALSNHTAGRQADREPQPARTHKKWQWLGAAPLGIAAIVAAATLWTRDTPPAAGSPLHVEITTPPTQDFGDLSSVAVSPDGKRLVFLAPVDGRPVLWLRSLDSFDFRPLTGTEGAYLPFWSADSRSVAFFTLGRLARVDLGSGLVSTIASVPFTGVGGDWNGRGVVLFVATAASPVSRVSADGGAPVEVTRLEPGHAGHGFPHFLPDGDRFLYRVLGSAEVSGIYMGRLDGSPARKVLDREMVAAYSAGHLLFLRDETLIAQPFDLDRAALSGQPLTVARNVLRFSGPTAAGALSASTAGTIAFRASAPAGTRRYKWLDRSGDEVGAFGEPDNASLSLSLSPDGRHVTFLRRTPEGNADVWLLDLQRNQVNRFTDNPAEDIFPIWSSDGRRILFTSNRGGRFALYEKSAATAGEEERVAEGPAQVFATDSSRDGRFILLQRYGGSGRSDLSVLHVGSRGEETPFARSEFDERGGRFSPDGRWIAYHSDRSGRFEVYVQPFPGPGAPVAVSINGGVQARWRADGEELFYLSPEGRLTAVRVQPGKDRLELGAAVPLFDARVGRPAVDLVSQYEPATPDGQRFLVQAVEPHANPPIRLIVNWNNGS